jgi:competence protein ComEC
MGQAALATLALLAGILWSPQAPPRALALLALLPLLAAMRWSTLRPLALAATVAAFGLLRLDAALAARSGIGEDAAARDLIGRVVSPPAREQRRLRFEFDVEQGALSGRRLQLVWYGSAEVRAGERWELTVRLRRPRAALNPGGQDLEAHWLTTGIDGLGTVRTGQRLAPAAPGIAAARQALIAQVAAACAGRGDACGVVAGLAVGQTRAISAETWRVLRRTGTVHLVAISGLHVTLLGALVAWLVAGAAARWAWLTRRLPAALVGGWVGVAVATGYALLAGFSVPTRRTLIMLIVCMLARSLRRRIEPHSVLAAALLAVLAFDPFAVLAAGFWLSFVGVALLMIAAADARPLRALLQAQWATSLGLAPVLLALFGSIPAAGPLANLVAIPLFNLVLLPLVLAGCVLAPWSPATAATAFDACAAAFDLLFPLLAALGEALPPLARHGPGGPALVLAALGIGWLLAPRGLPGRALAPLLLLPLLLARPPALAPGAVELVVLDVGHGLATVVRTREHALVYDTGPSGFGTDAGEWALIPALAALGVGPDRVVISHADADHAGGAATLAREHREAAWYVGDRAWFGRACRAGQRWRWDGVDFELLHPQSVADDGSENDRSCVLKVSGPGGRVLLPGDLEAEGERRLLAAGVDLRAEVLVAPHHGSASSSTPAFVAAVAPLEVLYSVGHRNRWGFPRAEVVARYRAVGARQWQTGRDGALTVRFDAGRPPQVSGRRAAPRVWREP